MTHAYEGLAQNRVILNVLTSFPHLAPGDGMAGLADVRSFAAMKKRSLTSTDLYSRRTATTPSRRSWGVCPINQEFAPASSWTERVVPSSRPVVNRPH